MTFSKIGNFIISMCNEREHKEKCAIIRNKFFLQNIRISKYDFFIERVKEREREREMCFFLSFLNIHQLDHEIIDTDF